MKENIREVVLYASLFHQIGSQIEEWNLEKIQGIGFYKRHSSGGNYAHIELSIVENTEQFAENCIIWNINEQILPSQIGYKRFIERVLSFFASHVSALKGKYIKLQFEINDGSYQPVDTRPRHFEIATIYALINCFDKGFKPLRQKDKEYIEVLQKRAIEFSKKNNP